MERRFERLRNGGFDLLVIGGGIYGAWTAYDAALRGLRVALIEKDDWGSGTSSASSKLIHGGLRYLEYLRIGQVRKGLQERRRLQRLGPHRIRALRFVLPLYSGSGRGRLKLKAGLWFYDRLAGRDNGVGRHHSMSRGDMLRRFDFLEPERLHGGFTYGDCQTDDARLTLEIVDGAIEAGAVAVNRAAATELLVDGGRVVGARVSDRETGDGFDVRAALTVNCAGAWSESLLAAHGAPRSPLMRFSRGAHLVMPALPTERAFMILSRSHGKVVFMIPWYGRTLLGTTDSDHEGPPEEARVEESDVEYLLERANSVLRDVTWEPSDVVSSFVGLRALPAGNGPSPSVSRDWRIEEPLPQLFLSVGGKLTSARADAAFMVHRVVARLGRDYAPCPTLQLGLPWKPQDRFRAWFGRALDRGLSVGLDEEVAQSCLYRYGSRVDRLFDMVGKLPRLADRIVPDAPFCLAELVYAVRYEMARSLEDVFVRRVPLMRVAPPPPHRLAMAAKIMGKILGWSERRKDEEAAALVPPSATDPGGLSPEEPVPAEAAPDLPADDDAR